MDMHEALRIVLDLAEDSFVMAQLSGFDGDELSYEQEALEIIRELVMKSEVSDAA